MHVILCPQALEVGGRAYLGEQLPYHSLIHKRPHREKSVPVALVITYCFVPRCASVATVAPTGTSGDLKAVRPRDRSLGTAPTGGGGRGAGG